MSSSQGIVSGKRSLASGAGNTELQVARLLGCILFSFAIFALWPEIDLVVAHAFHDPATGFAIEGNPITETLRSAVWNLAILICLAAAFGTVIGLAARPFLLPTRAWGFILALYLLGPGVMVELVAKPLWGRGRPAHVVDYGGTLPFSPPNELVGYCLRNCSFVSGEVSGATVTALALLLLRVHLRRRLRPWGATLLGIGALSLPPLVALQRIAAGRHFLSDAIFAVLFTLLLALALSVLLRPLQRKDRRTAVGPSPPARS